MEPLTRAHLDDGELIALLDGEAEGAEHDAGHAHLATCAACRERMVRYRVRRERLARLLVRSDFPAASPASDTTPTQRADAGGAKVIPLRPRTDPRRVETRPWLRAAAVVLVLLGAALAATPARAWIARWMSRQWERVAQHQAPPPPVHPTPAPPAQQVSAQVRFVPAGSEMRVDVAHAQQAGTLTLLPVDGAAATAQATDARAADLLVVPSGLRIRNTAGTTADYRVQVPATVRRVRVHIGSREVDVAREEIGAEGRVIPLAGG